MDKKMETYLIHYIERIFQEFRFAKLLLTEYSNLNDRILDHLDELKIASSFFKLSMQCFLNELVLTLSKLFSNYKSFRKNGKDIFKLFRFIESNNIDSAKISRKELLEGITKHRGIFSRFTLLFNNIFMWRNKCIAHYDKKYFLNPNKISVDAPFSQEELSELIDSTEIILKDYEKWFLDYKDTFEYLNQCDINNALRMLAAYKAEH